MNGRKQSKRKGGIFTSRTESNIPHKQPALARPGHQPPLGRTPAGETHRVATQHVDHPDDMCYDDDDDDPCSSPVAGTSDSLPR